MKFRNNIGALTRIGPPQRTRRKTICRKYRPVAFTTNQKSQRIKGCRISKSCQCCAFSSRKPAFSLTSNLTPDLFSPCYFTPSSPIFILPFLMAIQMRLIAILIITMSGDFNIDSLFKFLQKACSSVREMQAITPQEIQNAAKQLPQLRQINQKGLLVLMLAKILHQKYFSFHLSLNHYLGGMFKEKVVRTRKRKEDEEDLDRPVRRRRTKKVNLGEVASESISNPVKILPPNPQEFRDLGAGRKEDDNSKGSNPSSGLEHPETDFNQALTEIGQNFGFAQGEPTNPEHDDSSQSNSTNSSIRFGAIANLSKKVDIIGQSFSFQAENRTVRRARNSSAANRTTRRKAEKFDEKINLDETATTMRLDKLDITYQAIQNRHRQLDDHAKYLEFEVRLEKNAEELEKRIFSTSNLAKLQRLVKKKAGGAAAEQRVAEEHSFVPENTDFSDPTDYAPVASTSFQPSESLFRDHLQANIFDGQQALTLSDLQQRAKKPKYEIFQNLLWLVQRGEVVLTQENPEQFGEISISRLEQQA